jgi:hypothetical protein
MGHALEAGVERLRNQLPGPARPGGGQLEMPTQPTVIDIDPHIPRLGPGRFRPDRPPRAPPLVHRKRIALGA